MAIYRGKYILEGLDSIPPEMEKDLDLAYDLCSELKASSPCAMCGKCCHQPFITVRDEEVERVAAGAGMEMYDFIMEHLYREDGRWLFKTTNPCAFLREDNRCRIWKDRPEICDDFPYMVSMFMGRVYLAITHPDHDIMGDLEYMDDTWPCTPIIKSRIGGMIDEARRKRQTRS